MSQCRTGRHVRRERLLDVFERDAFGLPGGTLVELVTPFRFFAASTAAAFIHIADLIVFMGAAIRHG
jgi:hypothetical protein